MEVLTCSCQELLSFTENKRVQIWKNHYLTPVIWFHFGVVTGNVKPTTHILIFSTNHISVEIYPTLAILSDYLLTMAVRSAN
jgi:hypothetical protein